jgi:peptidoglycan/xylan/chitin deacetylase (PgdA/CDA1 family)
MLKSAHEFADMLRRNADRIERLAGGRPCHAFRPHAGWRSWSMYDGLRSIDHRLVGWSWMLWDWKWFRPRTADAIVKRIGGRAADGDIIVLHDGDESAPFKDQRQTVDATARLIPLLRGRGLSFGTIRP